jgi:hypothetical protein
VRGQDGKRAMGRRRRSASTSSTCCARRLRCSTSTEAAHSLTHSLTPSAAVDQGCRGHLWHTLPTAVHSTLRPPCQARLEAGRASVVSTAPPHCTLQRLRSICVSALGIHTGGRSEQCTRPVFVASGAHEVRTTEVRTTAVRYFRIRIDADGSVSSLPELVSNPRPL